MKRLTVNFFKRSIFVFALAVSLAGGALAQNGGAKVANFNITEEMVLKAQKAWGDALVKISETHRSGGDYKKVAAEIIDAAYNYQNGPVLFKPTLTTGEQTFRLDREGALAYFVGGDARYRNDSGFAIKGWKSVKIENKGIFLDGDVAVTMGNVRILNHDGTETVVDKTWGFKMDEYGKPRIFLHHSSLPYKPAK